MPDNSGSKDGLWINNWSTGAMSSCPGEALKCTAARGAVESRRHDLLFVLPILWSALWSALACAHALARRRHPDPFSDAAHQRDRRPLARRHAGTRRTVTLRRRGAGVHPRLPHAPGAVPAQPGADRKAVRASGVARAGRILSRLSDPV